MIQALLRGRPLLGTVAVVIAGLTLAPSVYLVIRAFGNGAEQVWRLLTRQRVLDLTLNTLLLASTVAVACLILGIVSAWLITMTDLPLRGLWAAILAAPLAIPSYVTAFVWISEFPFMAGFRGAFVVMTLSCFPLVTLPVAAAMRAGDRSASEVSRTLGRGPVNTALFIGSRRIAPAAAAGVLLVVLYTISDFGAVALMRFDVYTLGIYSAYRGSFDRTSAAVLGIVLLVLTFACTLGERALRSDTVARNGAGAPRPPEEFRLGPWRYPAVLAVAAVGTISTVVPIGGLLRWMRESIRLSIDWADVFRATMTTVEFAAMAAVVVVILAWPVAVFAARSRSVAARSSEIAVYLAHGLPGITVGLAMVFFGIRVLPDYYQTAVLLILAYVVLFLPLAVGSTRAALAAVPVALEDSSRLLGAGRTWTDLRVNLPIAFPAVAAGAALVFLTVAKELPVTLMLRPRGDDTLSTSLWTLTEVFKYGEAAPYALAIIAVSAIPSFALQQLLSRGSRSHTS